MAMDISSLQCISLEAASASSLDPVLRCLVNGLSREPEIVLARVWLVRPGDICGECHLREQCPDQTRCLHLVASAGTSSVNPEKSWTNTAGHYQRMPLGVRKVGRVGATGEGLLLDTKDKSWDDRPG